ncbi:MAG: ATP-binding protein, partial [Gemmatimonadaceae bacterium]
NDILNLTRVTSGKLAYNITNVKLGEVISDAESMIVPQLEAAQLTYEKILPADDCVVRADADKLRQVVINLLGNSIKFTDTGGHISIEVKGVEGDEGSVGLAIRDTGIGIPESDLQTIFDPFVQVDARLSSTREGAGLGLAISRDLARGMGGDLWAESVVGEGSVLTVMLNKGGRAE